FLDGVDASVERSRELVGRHRRPVKEASRSGRHPPIEHAGRRRVASRTDIDDEELGSGMARKNVRRRSASREVSQHLDGHLLRIGAHALERDAVIRREKRKPWTRELDRRRAAHASDPDRELLETSEASARLRFRVEHLASLLHRELARRNDRADRVVYPPHVASSIGPGLSLKTTPNRAT